MRYTYIIILLSIHLLSFSQKGFNKGYIIDFNYDTTFGKIKLKRDAFGDVVQTKILFKKVKTFRKKLSSFKISEYNISGYGKFCSVFIDDRVIIQRFFR